MAKARPSDARRKALAEQITVPDVSNFFPLERYYDAADKLYNSVQQTAASRKDWDLCYVYCKRYCIFCLEAIPTHNYYGTPKYRQLQNQHNLQVDKVLTILEDVATAMDQQEIQRAAQLARQQEERERKEQERLEEWQRRLQQQKRPSASGSANVEQSAMDKLKLLQQPKPSSTRYRFEDSDDDNDAPNHAVSLNGVTPLPPPLLPLLPPTVAAADAGEPAITPPSYDAVVKTSKYHPFFGPSLQQDTTSFTVRPPEEDRPEQPLPRQQPPAKPLPMRQLQDIYKNMYLKYQNAGKIQVFPIDTYQGRVSESTNGCTVISALIAALHLNNATVAAITNEAVKQIIDKQCGPILRDIRRKLGLGAHALIIPSDVHDHLVDAKILHQEYFSGAAGGNIMDQKHSGEFIKLLGDVKDKSNGKAAATLFFREHVISIVKFTDAAAGRRACYDLIDSMPGITSHSGKSMATRTRCNDLSSLKVLLQWYASRKFSDSNCAYIDRNPWDDSMADLDPRVFQGFVWST